MLQKELKDKWYVAMLDSQDGGSDANWYNKISTFIASNSQFRGCILLLCVLLEVYMIKNKQTWIQFATCPGLGLPEWS